MSLSTIGMLLFSLLSVRLLTVCSQNLSGSYSTVLHYPGDTGFAGMGPRSLLIAPMAVNPVNRSESGWYFNQKFDFLVYDTFASSEGSANPGRMLFGDMRLIWAVLTVYSPPTTVLPFFTVFTVGSYCDDPSDCDPSDAYECAATYFPVEPILNTAKIFLYIGEDDGSVHPEIPARMELLGVEYDNSNLPDDKYYYDPSSCPYPQDRVRFVQLASRQSLPHGSQSMVIEGVGYQSESPSPSADMKLGFGTDGLASNPTKKA